MEKPAGTYHHGGLRHALLDAAEKELADKGVEGFTLRACARRAGVSHAAPAHHFRDARALLTALAAEGFRRFVEAIESRQRGAGSDPKARLTASGLGYIDFARAHPALFRLMFSSNRPNFSNPELKQAAGAAFATLVDAVAALGSRDPRSDPQAMADVAACWAMAHGLADLALSGQLPAPQKNPDAFYAAIFSRAFAQPQRG